MEQFEKGLVSIIIPVFNRESLLPETLDSIVSQTYEKWECIIVDDGSIDSSLDVALGYAKKDNRFKVYSRPWYKKKGANSCRNYGFKLSKGEFIQWLDSDDILELNMIYTAIEKLANCNYTIAVSKALFFRENLDNIISSKTYSNEMIGTNAAFEYFTLKWFFQTSQIVLRKSDLNCMKHIFDINLKRNQETEFIIRLILQDFKILFIQNTSVFIRLHDDSITQKYTSADESLKFEMDFKAYQLIYYNLRNSSFFSELVKNHFSSYFQRCLKKVNRNSFTFLRVYLFCLFNRIFPSFIISSKIFLIRLVKNV
jgi:glycosyltransferase involved in cell wall biosynthesis